MDEQGCDLDPVCPVDSALVSTFVWKNPFELNKPKKDASFPVEIHWAFEHGSTRT